MAERCTFECVVEERNMLKRLLDELRARHDTLRAQLESERELGMGRLERAWHVIANAHRDGNGWADAPADWQEAAVEFREHVWKPALRARDAFCGLCKVCGSRPGCGELRGLCESCHLGTRVSFVLAGGDFTGRDEHAFAEAVKTAARRGATALHAELKKTRRREAVARGWLAVQGVASFLALYPEIESRQKERFEELAYEERNGENV